MFRKRNPNGMRQATRELVKAYIHGLDSTALDDIIILVTFNINIFCPKLYIKILNDLYL